jgi:hypothetical protein
MCRIIPRLVVVFSKVRREDGLRKLAGNGCIGYALPVCASSF